MLPLRRWPVTRAKHLSTVLVLSLQVILPFAAAQLDSQWFVPANQGRAIGMDGNLRTFPGEWDDASRVRFDQSPYPPQRVKQPPGPDVYAIYAKTYSNLLYLAWNLTESDPVEGSIEIFIDPMHDRSSVPQPRHRLLHIERSGTATVYQGTGSGWEIATGASWIHAETNRPWGWQGEVEIPLSDLRTGAPGTVPMGIAFRVAGAGIGFWPSSSSFDTLAPDSWGTLLFPMYTTVTTTALTTTTLSRVNTSTQTLTTALDTVATIVTTMLRSATRSHVVGETLTEIIAVSETKSVVTTRTSTQATTRTAEIVFASTLVLEQRFAGLPSWILLVAAILGSIAFLVYSFLRGERRSR